MIGRFAVRASDQRPLAEPDPVLAASGALAAHASAAETPAAPATVEPPVAPVATASRHAETPLTPPVAEPVTGQPGASAQHELFDLLYGAEEYATPAEPPDAPPAHDAAPAPEAGAQPDDDELDDESDEGEPELTQHQLDLIDRFNALHSQAVERGDARTDDMTNDQLSAMLAGEAIGVAFSETDDDRTNWRKLFLVVEAAANTIKEQLDKAEDNRLQDDDLNAIIEAIKTAFESSENDDDGVAQD